MHGLIIAAGAPPGIAIEPIRRSHPRKPSSSPARSSDGLYDRRDPPATQAASVRFMRRVMGSPPRAPPLTRPQACSRSFLAVAHMTHRRAWPTVEMTRTGGLPPPARVDTHAAQPSHREFYVQSPNPTSAQAGSGTAQAQHCGRPFREPEP
jgi:hypothetical protein